MKNLLGIKEYPGVINEWMDSPGSVDVPGQNTELKVNRRNYTSTNPDLPIVADAMYEAADFHNFLDEECNTEEFNNFIKKKNISGRHISRYLKKSFTNKRNGNN